MQMECIISSILNVLISLMITEQFFYQELNFKKKDWKWIVPSTIGCAIVASFFGVNVIMWIELLLTCGVIVIKSGKKKWKRIFYVIPAQMMLSLLVSFSILAVNPVISVTMDKVLEARGSMEYILVNSLSYVLILAYVVYYYLYKKGEVNIPEFRGRAIAIITLMLFINQSAILEQDMLKEMLGENSQWGGLLFTSFIVVLLNIYAYLYILKSEYANFYKELHVVNKQYLDLQLKYFDAYKQNQEATRSFKHDVNNHLHCMRSLCEKDKKEDLLRYMSDMTEQVEEFSILFTTGNDVADAIISEKYSRMSQEHIHFSCEGQLRTDHGIEPMDLCTVFANALDNAIEECEKIEAHDQRSIQLEIKNSRNFTVITIRNTVKEKVKINRGHIVTSKEDKENHGWGLRNIKRAVNKYGGHITLYSDENQFSIEMIL